MSVTSFATLDASSALSGRTLWSIVYANTFSGHPSASRWYLSKVHNAMLSIPPDTATPFITYELREITNFARMVVYERVEGLGELADGNWPRVEIALCASPPLCPLPFLSNVGAL